MPQSQETPDMTPEAPAQIDEIRTQKPPNHCREIKDFLGNLGKAADRVESLGVYSPPQTQPKEPKSDKAA